jgi:hypothetical protein
VVLAIPAQDDKDELLCDELEADVTVVMVGLETEKIKDVGCLFLFDMQTI